jgi:hypothetical protein
MKTLLEPNHHVSIRRVVDEESTVINFEEPIQVFGDIVMSNANVLSCKGFSSIGTISTSSLEVGSKIEVYDKLCKRVCLGNLSEIQNLDGFSSDIKFGFYDASTVEGMSGTPVFIENKIVGVHYGGDSCKAEPVRNFFQTFLNYEDYFSLNGLGSE